MARDISAGSKREAARATSNTASVAAPAKAVSIKEVKGGPTVEQVRLRAYQLYVERTARGLSGDAASDWLKAEQELVRG